MFKMLFAEKRKLNCQSAYYNMIRIRNHAERYDVDKSKSLCFALYFKEFIKKICDKCYLIFYSSKCPQFCFLDIYDFRFYDIFLLLVINCENQKLFVNGSSFMLSTSTVEQTIYVSEE